MPKQIFCLSKSLKSSILFVFPAAIIMLFAFVIMLPVVPESTYAEGDNPEDGISITVSDSVSANLVLFEEGDYKIAKDTVQVSSSASYGYELFLSTDSEEHQSIYLNNDPTSSSVISPVAGTIDEPAVLTSNTWGFAIAGQGNFDNEYSTTSPDSNSHFAIIPTTNDQAVYENNSATADDDIDFYYGIKIEPTLEPGEYTTSASYTAIAKLPPLTAKAVLGTNRNLNFIHDRNTYTVGETYTDNIGETTIYKVFDVPSEPVSTSYLLGWNGYSFIHVNFDSSFHDFKPTSTAYWFSECPSLFDITHPENLNTAEVTNMSYMFAFVGTDDIRQEYDFELDLSGWDTSKVTNMARMFLSPSGHYMSSMHIVLNDWDVSKVTDMSNMFGLGSRTSHLKMSLELKNWDVSNNPNMMEMFPNADIESFDANLSGWKIGTLFTPPSLSVFNAKSCSLNLSSWDVERATSTNEWFFNYCGNSETVSMDLSNWKNMTNITTMWNMFFNAGYHATTFNLSLSGWNTGSVVNMNNMFSFAGYNATTWSIGDLSSWDTGNVSEMSFMFFNAGFNASVWDIGNIRNWNVTHVISHTMFFSSQQTNIDVNKLPWQTP